MTTVKEDQREQAQNRTIDKKKKKKPIIQRRQKKVVFTKYANTAKEYYRKLIMKEPNTILTML